MSTLISDCSGGLIHGDGPSTRSEKAMVSRLPINTGSTSSLVPSAATLGIWRSSGVVFILRNSTIGAPISKGLQLWGLLKGVRSSPVLARKPSMRPGLHPLEPGLHQRGQLADVAFGQVGQGPLQVRPHRFHRVEFVRIRRELADGQPVPGGRPARPSRLTWAPRLSHTSTMGPPSCWCAASSRRA